MTEPTDSELWQLHMQMPGVHKNPIDFARAVLAKWGTPPAGVGEPVAYRHMHDDGWEYYDAPTGSDCPGCEPLYTTPQPTQAQAGAVPLTDDRIVAAANEAFNTTVDLDDETLVNKYGHGVYISRFIDFARTIEAEVRKDDETLIRQMLEALELSLPDLRGLGLISPTAAEHAERHAIVIAAARARLEKAP